MKAVFFVCVKGDNIFFLVSKFAYPLKKVCMSCAYCDYYVFIKREEEEGSE